MDCVLLAEPVTLVTQLVAGIATGGVYALVGIGLVLIYKTSHVVNFAQGDLLMWGAYAAFALVTLGLPFPFALLATLLVAGVFGVAIERALLRRMIGQPVIAMIIVTLGLSSVLRGLAYLTNGTEVRRFPDDVLPTLPIAVGELTIAPVYVWSLAISAVVFVGITLFFRYSRHGIALRAAADDLQAAMSVGVRVSSVFALSWALSAAVAAIGGVLLANLTGVNFTLADFGLLVFPVVILGGLDSIVGALVGGLVVGVLQSTAAAYLDPCVGGGLKAVVPFLVLAAILLVKPHGLFGRVQVERI
jgi:branched-chain amino acid transport system permease protein